MMFKQGTTVKFKSTGEKVQVKISNHYGFSLVMYFQRPMVGGRYQERFVKSSKLVKV